MSSKKKKDKKSKNKMTNKSAEDEHMPVTENVDEGPTQVEPLDNIEFDEVSESNLRTLEPSDESEAFDDAGGKHKKKSGKDRTGAKDKKKAQIKEKTKKEKPSKMKKPAKPTKKTKPVKPTKPKKIKDEKKAVGKAKPKKAKKPKKPTSAHKVPLSGTARKLPIEEAEEDVDIDWTFEGPTEEEKAVLDFERQQLEEHIQHIEREKMNLANELFSIKPDLDKKTKMITDLKDDYDRLRENFDNYKKRMRTEAKEKQKFATEKIIEELLEVLDNFDRTNKLDIGKADKEDILKGIQLIQNQMLDLLKREGLKPIHAVGEPFDPYVHEAITTMETDDHPNNTVLEELQKGYMFKSKVLRASKVRVSQSDVIPEVPVKRKKKEKEKKDKEKIKGKKKEIIKKKGLKEKKEMKIKGEKIKGKKFKKGKDRDVARPKKRKEVEGLEKKKFKRSEKLKKGKKSEEPKELEKNKKSKEMKLNKFKKKHKKPKFDD